MTNESPQASQSDNCLTTPAAPRTLGEVLGSVASSESAYQHNIKIAERYEAKGSPEALWWRIQAGALCFRPNAAESPGIDRLEAVCQAEFGSGLTAENLRRIRGTLVLRLKCSPDVLDSMTIEETVDAVLSAMASSGSAFKGKLASDTNANVEPAESHKDSYNRIRVLTHHSRPGQLDWREVRLSACVYHGTAGPATEELYFGTVDSVGVYCTVDGCWFFVDPSRGEGHYQTLDQASELFRRAGRPVPHELGGTPTTTTTTEPPTSTMNPKRSTAKGEGRTKLIAALTKHHKYSDSSCLNPEPIGNNELARMAEVSPSTATKFFDNEFNTREPGGYAKYRAICRDAGRLVDSLKALNGEFSPHDLYGRRPPGEDVRDDDE